MFGDGYSRRQGDLGEAAAIAWLTRQGANVLVPLFHSPDYDLVADVDGRLVRVQVKTSRCRSPAGRFSVALCTKGGNRSWNGTIKYLDSSRCDYLFALVADGRRWFIPVGALECRSAVALGGPKYAAYEVDRGQMGLGPSLDSQPVRGDTRAVKGAAL